MEVRNAFNQVQMEKHQPAFIEKVCLYVYGFPSS